METTQSISSMPEANLIWNDVVDGMDFSPGMIVMEENGECFLVGDVGENDSNELYLKNCCGGDDRCEVCTSKYSQISPKRYAWLFPYNKKNEA